MRLLGCCMVACLGCGSSSPARAPVPAPAPLSSPDQPAYPNGVVATLDGESSFRVLPSGKGILVAAGEDSKGVASSWWVDKKRVVPLPGLLAGLPAVTFRLSSSDAPYPSCPAASLELVAGAWPSLWAAMHCQKGDKKECSIYKQQGEQWTRMESIPGECTQLREWTPGAAIAVVQGDSGPELRSVGPSGPVPELSPRKQAQPTECLTLTGSIVYLGAWPSGEVVAAGMGCGVPRVFLERWAAQSTVSITADAELDPDGPFTAWMDSPDDVIMEGAGMLPGNFEESVSVQVHYRFRGGHYERVSIKEHEINAREQWLVNGPALAGKGQGCPEATEFLYQDSWVTGPAEVFVAGRCMKNGQAARSVVYRRPSFAGPDEGRAP